MAFASANNQSEALRQIAADAPEYRSYRPLDVSRQEIRVLDLDANLTCTVRHVSLADKPIYHALSYCWGSPTSTKTLRIRTIDQASNTAHIEAVPIRKTLGKFLKSLHAQFGTITVWLDVICINQRSYTEQSAQVAMMGDIYRRANHVYAWVGPWHPDIEFAFSCAHEFAKKDSAEEHDLEKVGAGLELLFYQPYWTRVWIIQECVLNARITFMCGNMAIDWKTLERITQQSRGALKQPKYFNRFEALQHARKRAAERLKSTLFEEVLRFQDTHCADPHDRIYGFRALTTVAYNLSVDYSSALFDLFIEAVSLENKHCFELCSQNPIARDSTDNVEVSSNSRKWWRYRSLKSMRYELGNDTSNFLEDSRKVSELMSIDGHDALEGLYDRKGDWLVVPLHEIEIGRHLLGLLPDDFERTTSYRFEETHIILTVLSDGKIVTATDDDISRGARDYSWLSRHNRLESHIWVCRVSQAAHMSRWVFANLLYRDFPGADKISEPLSSLRLASGDHVLDYGLKATELYHDCGCEKTSKQRLPPPWK